MDRLSKTLVPPGRRTHSWSHAPSRRDGSCPRADASPSPPAEAGRHRSEHVREARVRATGLAVAVALALAAGASPSAADFDGPPRPKIDCSKPENKSKPQCRKSYSEMSDDEIYNAAYWLARDGQYQEALDILAAAHDGNDKRILTATGFATRKLGDVDGAMPYYLRALAADPGYSLARSYLGEAFLSKGDLAAAKGQLAEIAARCGTACDGYPQLARRIQGFEAGRRPG